MRRRENHISSYASAFYVVLVESLWIPPAEGGFPSLHMQDSLAKKVDSPPPPAPSLHMLDSLSKSVFLHTNKWVPPYLIRVSLIQQAQQACLLSNLSPVFGLSIKKVGVREATT